MCIVDDPRLQFKYTFCCMISNTFCAFGTPRAGCSIGRILQEFCAFRPLIRGSKSAACSYCPEWEVEMHGILGEFCLCCTLRGAHRMHSRLSHMENSWRILKKKYTWIAVVASAECLEFLENLQKKVYLSCSRGSRAQISYFYFQDDRKFHAFGTPDEEGRMHRIYNGFSKIRTNNKNIRRHLGSSRYGSPRRPRRVNVGRPCRY